MRRRDDTPEGQARPPLPVRRLVALARPEARRLGWGTACLLLGAGAGLLYPRVLGFVVDDVERGDPAVLQRDVLLMLGIIAVQSVAIGLRMHLFTVAGERIVMGLRRRLFGRLLAQEIGFFDARRTGELVSRLASDTTVLQSTVTVNLSMALRNLLLSVGGLALMFAMAPGLAAVMLGLLPLVVGGALLMGRRFERLSRAAQDALADSGTVAEETLSGIRTVRAFAREPQQEARYAEAVARSFGLARRRSAGLSVLVGVTYFASFAALAVGLWIGIGMVMDGTLSPGDMTAFALYGITVGFALGGMGELWAELMRARGASARVFELLDREPAMPAGAGTPPPAALLPALRGHVRLEGVTFRYPARPEVAALHDVTLDLPLGRVLALVGPSGAGKSTVAALLSRLYDPDAGRVALDGVDLRQLDPAWLRERVGVVSQEPILFGASVAENIRFGRPGASDAEVQAAARAAHADGFIERLPQGYDTPVGERGVQLSGGQKQRVAIARAVLKDPAVLVLDEATSALDAESEALVRDALARLQRGRTVLVIAHRLSTVRDADAVAVLDGGRVVQRGRHEELLAEAEGPYARLVARQLAGA